MPAVRGQRPRRVVHDDIGAMAEHVRLDTDRGDKTRVARRHAHVLDAADGFPQGARQVAVRRRELVGELVLPALECGVALGDQDALVGVADPLHVDAQSEAIEKLRSQLALFRVHRAHEDESRGVAEGDALALDDVDAHCRGVEQHVDQVVIEQVDLVDVEDVAVRLGQDARLEPLGSRAQGRLDVDRAHDAILGGVDRKLDHPHAALVVRQRAHGLQARPAVGAQRILVGRVAAEVAALDDVMLRQQPRQRPNRRRLARPLFAPDQDATDCRHDGVEDERELHRLLADDRGERIGMTVERDAH